MTTSTLQKFNLTSILNSKNPLKSIEIYKTYSYSIELHVDYENEKIIESSILIRNFNVFTIIDIIKHRKDIKDSLNKTRKIINIPLLSREILLIYILRILEFKTCVNMKNIYKIKVKWSLLYLEYVPKNLRKNQ